MAEESDNLRPLEGDLMQARSAHQVFARILEIFTGLGILGQRLSLQHEGVSYRVSCDEDHFIVYRVNEINGPRHHVPGWPVCLVNADTVFDECSSAGLSQDHCTCGMDIDKWLELIQEFSRNRLEE